MFTQINVKENWKIKEKNIRDSLLDNIHWSRWIPLLDPSGKADQTGRMLNLNWASEWELGPENV